MLESMSSEHHIQHHQDGEEIHYHINYHGFKELHHPGGDPDRALHEMKLVKAGGWSLLTNNCIDQTYRILDAFGAGSALVDPRQRYRSLQLATIIPKKWFASAAGRSSPLEQKIRQPQAQSIRGY